TDLKKDVAKFTKSADESVIFLTPEEVIDEGTFKFRHLQTEGFCTLYVPAAGFWNTQSKYMLEARRAAKRMHQITRVFVVDDLSDLDNDTVLRQMRDDIAAGIQVYICTRADVAQELKAEPDFG